MSDVTCGGEGRCHWFDRIRDEWQSTPCLGCPACQPAPAAAIQCACCDIAARPGRATCEEHEYAEKRAQETPGVVSAPATPEPCRRSNGAGYLCRLTVGHYGPHRWWPSPETPWLGQPYWWEDQPAPAAPAPSGESLPVGFFAEVAKAAEENIAKRPEWAQEALRERIGVPAPTEPSLRDTVFGPVDPEVAQPAPEGAGENCTYCMGVGACPHCWGRAGIAALRARLVQHEEDWDAIQETNESLRARLAEVERLTGYTGIPEEDRREITLELWLKEREELAASEWKALVRERDEAQAALREIASRRCQWRCGQIGGPVSVCESCIARRALARGGEGK